MDRAIILGGGPSLCAEDVKAALNSGWPVIAVNNAWQWAPGCQVIYAGDLEWWARYYADVAKTGAALWTCHSKAAPRFGLNRHHACGPYNSGQRAIQFAAWRGAKTILLLGFDCSLRGGLHWHGAHPAEMSNPGARSVARWRAHFARLPAALPHVNIVNCSRYSEITEFPRLPLREALVHYTPQDLQHG